MTLSNAMRKAFKSVVVVGGDREESKKQKQTSDCSWFKRHVFYKIKSIYIYKLRDLVNHDIHCDQCLFFII